MKRIFGVVAVLFALGGAAGCGGGNPTSTTSAGGPTPLAGVWRITEATVTGPNPSTLVDPASLVIFAKTHYAMMRVVGPQPRSSFKSSDPVSDEKLAAYDSFVANAGTYEVSGATLTVRPIVAKHPNFMGGGSTTYDIRLDGETLWLTGNSTSTRYRIGGQLVAASDPPEQTRLKLVRVE